MRIFGRFPAAALIAVASLALAGNATAATTSPIYSADDFWDCAAGTIATGSTFGTASVRVQHTEAKAKVRVDLVGAVPNSTFEFLLAETTSTSTECNNIVSDRTLTTDAQGNASVRDTLTIGPDPTGFNVLIFGDVHAYSTTEITSF
jgi:hypothetical protein